MIPRSEAALMPSVIAHEKEVYCLLGVYALVADALIRCSPVFHSSCGHATLLEALSFCTSDCQSIYP